MMDETRLIVDNATQEIAEETNKIQDGEELYCNGLTQASRFSVDAGNRYQRARQQNQSTRRLVDGEQSLPALYLEAEMMGT